MDEAGPPPPSPADGGDGSSIGDSSPDATTPDAADATAADAADGASQNGEAGAFQISGSGTLDGLPIPLVSAYAIRLTDAINPMMMVTFTSYPDACKVYGAGIIKGSSVQLTVNAEHQDPGGHAQQVGPGTYPVVVPEPNLDSGVATFGWAGIDSIDSKCAALTVDYALVGTITLNEVTDAGVSGTFDLSAGADAGTAHGSFSLPYCPNVVSGGGGCQ